MMKGGAEREQSARSSARGGGFDRYAEGRVVARNAAEGTRAAVFFWYLRRVFPFLVGAMVTVVVLTFLRNGPVAGLLSAAIIAGLGWGLWVFTFGQWRRVWGYFRK